MLPTMKPGSVHHWQHNQFINESRWQLGCPLAPVRRCGQRWLVVQKLHDDNKSACINDNVSFCNMFANFIVSKIDSLKSALTSQLINIAPPPSDPVCSYPSLQLLEPVTSLEVSKLLSTIPSKSCCLNNIPTAIIKQRSSVLSEPIAYLVNLSFSRGTFPSKFRHASVTLLLKMPGLDPTVSANFQPTSNLNNISKMEMFLVLNRLNSSFGIMGFSHNKLKSYLSNRSFSVTFGSSSSFILPSSFGVPHGSVLGPILFTLYVSPIVSIVSSHGVN